MTIESSGSVFIAPCNSRSIIGTHAVVTQWKDSKRMNMQSYDSREL